ncbi:phosphatase domain-containing protein [Rubinisphaera margarita]|uniref:phosphatase domain-containing protein n=1 Tax=Rubinisphaera margarita TaxID=2909586 RepID=UPI001EE97795|nr:tyrosine-protein phosphatase [Rubinisphaera margarita]MCG6158570.1 tyrosine-protein phosphatase [Rubinisphaera margarita]
MLLLPYLLFAHAVWAAQVALSSEAAANNVDPALIISRRLRGNEYPDDVGLICDLTCELSDPRLVRSRSTYRCHPILDAGTVSAAELIAFAKTVPPTDQGAVLIHCANGHGRTGMFAAIWLIVHGYAPSAEEAIALLKTARPGVRLRPRQFKVVAEAGEILCENENQP